MKNLFKIIFVLTVFSCLFSGCKKYPEDDKRYLFKSPEKRLVGTWRIAKYYINGADSTDFLYRQYIGAPDYQYGVIALKISKVNGDPGDNSSIYNITVVGIGSAGGGMGLKKGKNYLNLGIGSLYGASPIYNPFINMSNWEIRELTNNAFKIKSNIGGVNYRVEFDK